MRKMGIKAGCLMFVLYSSHLVAGPFQWNIEREGIKAKVICLDLGEREENGIVETHLSKVNEKFCEDNDTFYAFDLSHSLKENHQV